MSCEFPALSSPGSPSSHGGTAPATQHAYDSDTSARLCTGERLRVQLTRVNVSAGGAVLLKRNVNRLGVLVEARRGDRKPIRHGEFFTSYLIADESEALSRIVPLALREGVGAARPRSLSR